jgi:hypothetical protein
MTLQTAIGMLTALVSAASGATSPPPLQLPAKELAAERYEYVTKVGELPEDIRKGLARQLEQRELQIADAGMSFSSGDAVIGNALWHGVINETYREPKELEAAIRTGTLWKPSTRAAQ